MLLLHEVPDSVTESYRGRCRFRLDNRVHRPQSRINRSWIARSSADKDLFESLHEGKETVGKLRVTIADKPFTGEIHHHGHAHDAHKGHDDDNKHKHEHND